MGLNTRSCTRCRELAAKLDAEKGITENALLASPEANGAAPSSNGSSPLAGEAEAAAAREDGEEDSPEEQVRAVLQISAEAAVLCQDELCCHAAVAQQLGPVSEGSVPEWLMGVV